MTGLARSTPWAAKAARERFALLQMAAVQDVDERQIETARHMSAFQARARFRRAALEAIGGTRVDDLGAAGDQAPVSRRRARRRKL